MILRYLNGLSNEELDRFADALKEFRRLMIPIGLIALLIGMAIGDFAADVILA